MSRIKPVMREIRVIPPTAPTFLIIIWRESHPFDRYQNFTVDKSAVIPDTCASFFSGRISWPTQLRHENAPAKPQTIGPVTCRSARICAPRSNDLTAVLRKAIPQAPRLPIANSRQASTAQLAKVWRTPIRQPDSKAASTPDSSHKRRLDIRRRFAAAPPHTNTILSRWMSSGSSTYPRCSSILRLDWPAIFAVSSAE